MSTSRILPLGFLAVLLVLSGAIYAHASPAPERVVMPVSVEGSRQ